MKSSIKGFFVILAIVISLVAVQGVCAETVTGTIVSISIKSAITENMIVLDDGTEDGTEVYGVKFNYLDNKYDIDLMVNQWVSVEVYEQECSDGTIKLKACKIAVGEDGEMIDLRKCP